MWGPRQTDAAARGQKQEASAAHPAVVDLAVLACSSVFLPLFLGLLYAD
jgi:hypothetical protein